MPVFLVVSIAILTIYFNIPKKDNSVNRVKSSNVNSDIKRNDVSSLGAIKYLPDSEKEFILSAINHYAGSDQKYSIEIRKGSINQSIETEPIIYKTDFIVDIKELKRSYKVISNYSPIEEVSRRLDDKILRIFCVRGADVRWEDSECKDITTDLHWPENLIEKEYNLRDD